MCGNICSGVVVGGFGHIHRLRIVLCFVVVHSGLGFAQSTLKCDVVVFVFQQQGDEDEEGVTSEEFDKFLEERAKAAEMVPSLPSPPSGDPGVAQGTPSRKKPDRPEDTLLAM